MNVLTETLIHRPCDEVSAYAADPSNAPEWYVNIESVNWKTAPPMQIGSRITFVARFLGRRLEYTYQVAEHLPGHRLVMKSIEGPFPMETSYTWQPQDAGVTRMTITNRGTPSGFAKLGGRLMAAAVKRASRNDLLHLKELLEGGI